MPCNHHLSVLKNVKTDNTVEHLSGYLTYFLSPVMTGVKSAELVTLKSECVCLNTWFSHKNEILDRIGLSFIELSVKNKSVSILFYDDAMLTEFTCNKRNNALLNELNYPMEGDLSAILEHLKYRFALKSFPHEIGLFLGYPEKDVIEFIENKGRNFNACHYWKVYGDVDTSMRLFKQIEDIREQTVRLISTGLSINQTIMAIKAM